MPKSTIQGVKSPEPGVWSLESWFWGLALERTEEPTGMDSAITRRH